MSERTSSGQAFPEESKILNVIYKYIAELTRNLVFVQTSFENFRTYIQVQEEMVDIGALDVPHTSIVQEEETLSIEKKDLSNKAFVREVMVFLESQESISRTKLMQQFALSQKDAETLLEVMQSNKLIGPKKGNGQYEVLKK